MSGSQGRSLVAGSFKGTLNKRLQGHSRLLECDRELSDLEGSSTARLCNHHSQLYLVSRQGRKRSVLSCFYAPQGARAKSTDAQTAGIAPDSQRE